MPKQRPHTESGDPLDGEPRGGTGAQPTLLAHNGAGYAPTENPRLLAPGLIPTATFQWRYAIIGSVPSAMDETRISASVASGLIGSRALPAPPCMASSSSSPLCCGAQTLNYEALNMLKAEKPLWGTKALAESTTSASTANSGSCAAKDGAAKSTDFHNRRRCTRRLAAWISDASTSRWRLAWRCHWDAGHQYIVAGLALRLHVPAHTSLPRFFMSKSSGSC